MKFAYLFTTNYIKFIFVVCLTFPIFLFANPSPWESWREAYTNFENGEKLRDQGDYTKALDYFNQAIKHYRQVRRSRPDWNQRVIRRRIADCESEIERMKRLLNATSSTAKKSDSTSQIPQEPQISATTAQAALAAANARANAARKELNLLQLKYNEKIIELDTLRRSAEKSKNIENELTNLIRDQRLAKEKYAILESKYQKLQIDSKQPLAQLQELNTRLLAQRMQFEQLKKKSQADLANIKKLEEDKNKMKAEGISNATKIKILNDTLARINTEISSIRSSKETLDKKIALQELAVKDATSREEKLKEKIKDLTNEITLAQNKLREALKEKGGNQKINTELLDTNKRLEGERNTYRNNYDSSQLQLAKEKLRTTQLSQELNDLTRKFQTAQAARLQLEKERDALKDTASNESALLKDAQSDIEKLRAQVKAMENDLKVAVEQSATLKKRLANRESEDFKSITLARQERDKLNLELETTKTTLLDLKNQLELKTAKISTDELKLKELTAKYITAAAQVKSLSDRLTAAETMRDKNNRIELLYKELQKNFQALQKENNENRLIAQAAKPREAELAQIKLRLVELDQLKNSLSKEQRLNEELKQGIRRLENDLAKLRPLSFELEKAKRELTYLDPLRKEVERLTILNKQLASAKDLESQLATAKSQLATFTATRTELIQVKKLNNELIHDRKVLQEELLKLRQLANTSSANAQLAQKIKKQHEELMKDYALREAEVKRLLTLKDNNLALEKDNAKLKLEVANLEKLKPQVEELAKAKLQLLENNQTIASLTNVKRQLDESNSNLANLKAEVSKLRLVNAETNQAKIALAKLQQENKLLLNQTPQEKANIAKLEGKLASLTQEIKLLKNDNSNLKKSLDKKQVANIADTLKVITQIKEKTAQITAQEKVISFLKHKVSELESSIKSNQYQYETKLTKEYTLLTTNYNNLKNQYEKALSNISNQKKQLDAFRLSNSNASENQLKIATLSVTNQKLLNKSNNLENENTLLKKELTQLSALKAEVETLRNLNKELASAKKLEGELAQIRLKLAEFERIQSELTRVTQLNQQLTNTRDELEKELMNRNNSRQYNSDIIAYANTEKLLKGNPHDLVASGVLAESNGSMELAIWNYEQALKINPRFMDASKRLGRLLLRQEEYTKAAFHLARAHATFANDIELSIDTIKAYNGAKRYGNAMIIVEGLLKTNPDNAILQLAAADTFFGSGQTSRAKQSIQMAMSLAPKASKPYMEMARFLVRTNANSTKEAATLYEKARILGAKPDIELEPKLGSLLDERREMTDFLNSAADEASRNNDWKTAIWYYRQLLNLGRNKDTYVPRLAIAQLSSGNAAAARETLAFNKVTPLSLVISSAIDLSEGNIIQGMSQVKRAVKLNGNRPVTLPSDYPAMEIKLGEILAKTSSVSKAQFKKLVQFNGIR